MPSILGSNICFWAPQPAYSMNDRREGGNAIEREEAKHCCAEGPSGEVSQAFSPPVNGKSVCQIHDWFLLNLKTEVGEHTRLGCRWTRLASSPFAFNRW
jgi:hypothetical protein